MPELAAPSSFFLAERHRLRAASARGPVLDLACGRGRHALPAAREGLRVIGIDRDPGFLAELTHAACRERLPLAALRADLEAMPTIPLKSGSCGAILVFRFLFRPLVPAIAESLAPGGLLFYETFTRGQLALGSGPRNPAFLLAPGELRQLFADWEILTYWEGVSERRPPEAVARLLARRRG